jgi:prevent-host-death family protein
MTHMETVGVREMRQNLSRYLQRVRRGESFTVTDRGEEVARLVPSGGHASPYARLASELEASVPEIDLLEAVAAAPRPDGSPALDDVIEELREDRL